jgi:hypothetical protein
METTRWTNPSQPQTLQSSVILLYINAAFSILFGGFSGLILLLAGGRVAAGWGCANERKWGYQLAIAIAIVPFLALLFIDDIAGNLFRLLLFYAFDILLLALLLHQQTRAYQRIWFR